MAARTVYSAFAGCLLGGALGDALGYPVEFMTMEDIRQKYGRNGIEEPDIDEETRSALISDDTQMTLFTAEGIMWAAKLGAGQEKSSWTTYVFYAYQRWLYTQTHTIASREYAEILDKNGEYASALLREKELFAQRAPEATCLMALRQAAGHNYGRFTHKINNSKGCGGIMRVAPAGLFFCRDSERAFRMAAEFAAITHTHPTGYLAAGALGTIVAELTCGADLEEAVDTAAYILRGYDGCMECCQALDNARSLYAGDTPPVEAVKRLGEGWTAEETLAVAVYCALCHSGDPANALRLAVNHSGDSDSTGAVCGNIIGAALGMEKLPKKWLKRLQLRDCIEETAGLLFRCAAEQ